jgi:hypothetical protein
MFLQSVLRVFLSFAQRTLVYDADINVHFLNVTPYAELAHELAARLADKPSGSSHHMLIDE